MRRLKYNLILLAMTALLLGVGFASWQVLRNPGDAYVENGFDSDDVIQFKDFATEHFNDYIVYNEKGFFAKSEFKINEKGETIIVYDSPKDTIDATVVIYANKCFEFFGETKIQIKISLTEFTEFNYQDENLNNYTMEHIFKNNLHVHDSVNSSGEYVFANLPQNIKYISEGVEKDTENDKYVKYVIIEVDLNEEMNDIISFDLKYKFEISDNDVYYEAFFKEISKYEDNKLFKMCYSLSFNNN